MANSREEVQENPSTTPEAHHMMPGAGDGQRAGDLT